MSELLKIALPKGRLGQKVYRMFLQIPETVSIINLNTNVRTRIRMEIIVFNDG